MKKNNGFTLIELVLVLIIAGCLAAFALPRFISVKIQTDTESVVSVAQTIQSASTINFAGSLAKGQLFGRKLATAPVELGVVDTSRGCSNALASSMTLGLSFAKKGKGTFNISVKSGRLKNVGDIQTCEAKSNDSGDTADFQMRGAK